MQIGTQFQFPDGYSGFKQGVEYILTYQDRLNNRVGIVSFPDEKHVALVMLERPVFEAAIAEGRLIENEHQRELPPWLDKLEGRNIDLVDELRRSAKIGLKTYVDQRIKKIEALIDATEEIFLKKLPLVEINRMAREIKPTQNESRIRLWFLLYLAYGKNQWALLPAFTKCGQWWKQVSDEISSIKRGRPSLLHGKQHGFNVDKSMLEKMIQGYARYSGLGITLKQVYTNVIRNIFGCKVTNNQHETPHIYQPENAPFPSPRQFSYHISKQIGKEKIRETIYGEQRFRRAEATTKGHYSEELAFLGERLEMDAHVFAERPAAFITGELLDSMHAVPGRDVLSGAILGVGFGFGGECSTTYRNMVFSMAVDKVYFCRLFGVEIVKEQWPCVGVPPNMLTDRGPGMSDDFTESINKLIHIMQFSRSFAPMDKAEVETSNPKTYKVEGKPVKKRVLLNPVELAKKEIYRILAFNRATDMSTRLTPEMIALSVGQSPLAIWNFMHTRGRTLLTQISLHEAVRRYLTKVEVSIHDDGAYMNGQRYQSYELAQSGLLQHANRNGVFKAYAFVLDVCVRTIWIDHPEGLIETEAKMNIRDDDSQLFLSLAEQGLLCRMNALANLKHQEMSNAVNLQYGISIDELNKDAKAQGRLGFNASNETAVARQSTKEAKAIVNTKKRRVA